jgi:8-oxo-dGTP pyrophosphatase MutT (NUDIX family)
MKFTDSYGTVVPYAGQEVRWRISGYAIVTNKDGHVLMVQSGSGLWHFPGGGIEIDEDMSKGVRRECLEETGYRVSVEPEIRHINEQYFYHRRKEEFYHSLQLFFLARLQEEVPDMSFVKGHDAERKSEWLDLSSLDIDKVHETVRELIKKLKT